MERNELLSKKVKINKQIAIDNSHRAYYIEMGATKEECYAIWCVYRIEEICDPPIFLTDENKSDPDIEKAHAYIKGFTKFDGCSNFKFPCDGMLHICGADEMVDLGIIFTNLYEMARETLQEYWN